jgi:hypothetical protein
MYGIVITTICAIFRHRAHAVSFIVSLIVAPPLLRQNSPRRGLLLDLLVRGLLLCSSLHSFVFLEFFVHRRSRERKGENGGLISTKCIAMSR